MTAHPRPPGEHDPGDPGDPPVIHDPEVAIVVRALRDLHVAGPSRAAQVLDLVDAPGCWLDPVQVAAVLTAMKPRMPADNLPGE